jgi:tetratricopeptide (TPR) repeat protein
LGAPSSPSQPPPPNPDTRLYLLALGLFVCALLSKSVTSSLPAVVLLIIYWKRGRIAKADVLPLLPFFALGLAMGSLTSWMERHIVGAQGKEFDFTIVDRILIAGRAVWFYVTKLAWPNPLIFMYPRWRIDDHALWQYVFPLAAIALIMVLWLLRHRIGRGPLVAALFFGGSLVPALGFVNVLPMRYSFVADHFQYLASLGLLTLFAVGVARYIPRGLIPHVSGALCLALAIVTWRHARDFSDLETLWQRTIAKNPSSWMAHNNYGVLLMDKGRIPEAVHEFETTMSLKPDHAESRLNFGLIAQHQGKLDEAERRFREAMSLREGYVDAYYNLGSLYVEQGRLPEAIELLQRTIDLAPNHHAAYTNLGMAFARQGRTADAMKQYQTAIRLNPDATLAHVNLGALYLEAGDLDRAAAEWTEVVRLDPNDAMALNNLGIVQAQRGRLNEAEQYFRRSLGSDPNYPDALTNLGIIYMKRGDAAAAASQFRHALRGDPKHARARAMLEQVENAR